MTRCPHCQADNPPSSNFCQQCGKRLPSPSAPADATLLMSATQVSHRPPQQRSYEVSSLFGSKDRLVIGRAADCDICLAHPSVSRYHARIERRPTGLYLVDLGSVNGVSLAGRRLTEPTPVHDADRVGIGPFVLSITHGVLRSVDNSKSLRLEAHHLEKVVQTAKGGPLKLLDDINLVVNPGEFVSLLGPSGSGKSTLMDCLNGRRRATSGIILANGEDFYRHFDSFRQSLGYVPQKDIVHTQLTVWRALFYTARLRLPPDTSRGEIEARIDRILAEMELGPHRHTLIANLSGGQIKRVSLGAELIGQPALLYIDEATSGLDAGTEARMMRLFRRLADEGRSIICITHNVDNVDRCHLILVLAKGKLLYYGPPAEAPQFFGVARLSDIYDRLADRSLDDWQRHFQASSIYRQFTGDRLYSKAEEPPAPPATSPEVIQAAEAPEPEKESLLSGLMAERFRQLGVRALWRKALLSPIGQTWHQLGVLSSRYVELTGGDRRGLRLLLLQAPIVALFLLIGFVRVDFRQTMPRPRKLEPSERRALVVVGELAGLLDKDRPLSDTQRRALSRVRVEAAGFPVPVDGNGIVNLFRQLQRDDLPTSQRRALEQARFTVDVHGEPETITAAEVFSALRQFQKSHIADSILQSDIVPAGEMINPRFTYTLLFVQVMIVLWFGCNNAAKEIVKEEAVYSRERAVNLGILPYLASKFLVLSVITVLHAGVLMLVLFGTLEALAWFVPQHNLPPAEHMLGYPAQFGVLVLLSMTGVALGLLLSACVSTPDRANALLPYVLIPQMILAGGLVSVDQGLLSYLAYIFSPVYWAYRAVHKGAHDLPPGFPGHVEYQDSLLLPCLALLAQVTILLVLTWVFMRRKDT